MKEGLVHRGHCDWDIIGRREGDMRLGKRGEQEADHGRLMKIQSFSLGSESL